MGSYKVSFRRSAEKEFRKVPVKDLRRIPEKIAFLSEDPRPPGSQLLKGENRYYRIRQGDYRIVYEADDSARSLIVIKLGHRREIYR